MSVQIHPQPHRLDVVVDRPDALNAVDEAVMSGLETALDRAEAAPDLKLFVLRGAGERSFISGGDLKAFADLTTAADGRDMARRMLAILARVEALPCWTLAALNGPAYGGGCETALAFDFRLAAAGATFGFTQGRFAVPPGWGGLTRLVELVGPGRAKAWLATCEVVSAPDALAAGLANWVAPEGAFDAELEALAERLMRAPRDLVVTLKAGADRAASGPRAAALAAELEPFAQHWASDEHHRRVAAFFDRSSS